MGTTVDDEGWAAEYDLNRSGAVDESDLFIVQAHYGRCNAGVVDPDATGGEHFLPDVP